ncbi:MAG TPA: glycoside hydrolase family 3 N-terminal domain-containing protein, partial [Gemmatimonadales bacterium]|nr:glycoside hydrolase family 3 N-terminal domain-containing protein [Gemmatimonadales bacterium]
MATDTPAARATSLIVIIETAEWRRPPGVPQARGGWNRCHTATSGVRLPSCNRLHFVLRFVKKELPTLQPQRIFCTMTPAAGRAVKRHWWWVTPALLLCAAVAARHAAPAPPQTSSSSSPALAPAPSDPVDSILALMTLEEKLGQLNQPTGPANETGPAARAGTVADIRAGRIGSFLGVYGAAYTREFQRVAVEESRLRIPLLFAHDVIHGFRTIFPVPLAEASSWDPVAVERSAHIAAIEGTAHGVHWTYAPMVDIGRDPRWGRVVEGSGEDPYLGSAMAAARVRGFQGADSTGWSEQRLASEETLLATAKHFVAYGAAEGGRDYNIADISPQTLHDIYLPPFRAAVDAGAQSVMAAFNEIAGVPMHAHRHLIRDVLRREWGFDGVLVSDYTGILELIPHGVAADSTAAGILGIRAGVDVDMVSTIYLNHLPRLVRQGVVPESLINQATRRVLKAKQLLGLFDDPYRYSDTVRERSRTLTASHLAHAREMARKSIVLLKNSGRTLPLSKRLRSVAVIGVLANDSASALGSWAAAGRPEDAVTVLEGIRRAVAPKTRVLYARGADVATEDTSGFAEAVRMARRADAVILVLGEDRDMSAEARNRSSLDLPGVQQQLAQRIAATRKPLAVVLMNGRPLSISWLDANVPAIMETWYLGVQMGPAVADVLFGDYNPGGKLPITVPRSVGQVPIYYNYKNTGRPSDEKEKYTSKYLDLPSTPLYPFGHGLSYTTFRYS